MNNLSGVELTNIGIEMFGKKWKPTLASAVGISPARIYQLASADVVTKKSAQKVLEVYAEYKRNHSTIDQTDVSDEEIAERIQKRFDIMLRMVDGMVAGHIRSMIVSGAPGIGKTYDIEHNLSRVEKRSDLEVTYIKGTASAPGLYHALHNVRNGGIVVIDDSDSIFNDEQAFNILKAALDTSDKRMIAWHKLSSWIYFADDGEEDIDDKDRLPNKFEFKGGVIFITNIDFEDKIDAETKMSSHFQALMSRSLYLDLTLKTVRDRIVRMEDVFINKMRHLENLDLVEAQEIIQYVKDNATKLQEISLRCVKHICHLYRLGSDWKQIVEVTKFSHR